MDVKSLADQLFFTTVRVDTINQKNQKGSGTAFPFSFTRDENEYPFVVTNKHVINSAKSGGLTFIVRDGDKPKLGESYRLDFDEFAGRWHGHPDPAVDIAVLPLAPLEAFIQKSGTQIFYRTISSSNIPTQQQIEELDSIEEIRFLGYPIGLWDTRNYLPIARTGTTATPLIVDFESETQFLIDASVFGGSSGSPVFVYKSGAIRVRGGGTRLGGELFFFVGVVAAVYYRTAEHEIVPLPIPTVPTQIALGKEMLDLGVVFKSSTVIETVESALRALGA